MENQPFSPIPSLEELASRITDPIIEGPGDIIPGLLPRQGQLVIAGETNVGKSLSAIEICSSYLMNTPLWGELQPTCQAKKILYVLGEHYKEVIQKLWRVTQLPMNDQVYLLGPEHLGYDKWLVSNGRPNPQAVNKFHKWAEGVDLIVFDPFSAFVTGVEVENDNIQMRLALDTMSLIAQKAGASCLVLAHQGKPSMDQYGQERHRKSYAIRGASAIEDAATNIFYMGRAQGESAAAETREHKLFTMTCRKYKGEAPSEYRLMRDNSTLTHTLLGNRPFVELRRIETNAKVAKIQNAFPTMAFSDVIKMIAVSEGMSEATIRRYLS